MHAAGSWYATVRRLCGPRRWYKNRYRRDPHGGCAWTPLHLIPCSTTVTLLHRSRTYPPPRPAHTLDTDPLPLPPHLCRHSFPTMGPPGFNKSGAGGASRAPVGRANEEVIEVDAPVPIKVKTPTKGKGVVKTACRPDEPINVDDPATWSPPVPTSTGGLQGARRPPQFLKFGGILGVTLYDQKMEVLAEEDEAAAAANTDQAASAVDAASAVEVEEAGEQASAGHTGEAGGVASVIIIDEAGEPASAVDARDAGGVAPVVDAGDAGEAGEAGELASVVNAGEAGEPASAVDAGEVGEPASAVDALEADGVASVVDTDEAGEAGEPAPAVGTGEACGAVYVVNTASFKDKAPAKGNASGKGKASAKGKAPAKSKAPAALTFQAGAGASIEETSLMPACGSATLGEAAEAARAAEVARMVAASRKRGHAAGTAVPLPH